MTSSAQAWRSKKPTDCQRDWKTCETRKQTGREGICTRVTAGCGCCRKETLPRGEVPAVKSLQEGARGRKPFRTFIARRGVYVGRSVFCVGRILSRAKPFPGRFRTRKSAGFQRKPMGPEAQNPLDSAFCQRQNCRGSNWKFKARRPAGAMLPVRQLVKNLFLTN